MTTADIEARFIVSTGRCGSTVLSSILGEHPAVLALPEFFSALHPGAFPRGSLTGEDFWRLLATPNPVWTAALRRGVIAPEFRYPLDGSGHFSTKTGIPPILAVTLPTITDEPEALYAELEDVVPTFSSAPVGDMYKALFEWLAHRTRRAVWVERSGGSLLYVSEIVRTFGGGRFVHLFRDGVETAISMSDHPYFRLQIAVGTLDSRAVPAPAGDGAEHPGSPSSEPGDGSARLDAALDHQEEASLEHFGRRWSAMQLIGARVLSSLPASRVMHLAYEDLVTSPRDALQRVVAFFEFPEAPPGWLDATAARIVPQPRLADKLSAEALASLRRACLPGLRVTTPRR